ncbi:hypothetical protein AMS68_003835 [Peltaster fructicola]|uniref:Ecp2 effector protein domain-containing protein n=1 Tax=Peltaster fructicola TaxID=286661 RepID=A0A6H0XUM9_9PEZI|nr:hypothetical protein AMS68_003835 [Peltaster fructicola]
MPSIYKTAALAATTALVFITGTNAGVIPQDNSTQIVSRGVQTSCTAGDWWHTKGAGDECWNGAYYTVNIDITYDSGNGCEPVRNGINNAVKAAGGWGGIWDYKCTADDKGATVLQFSACQSHGKAINWGLTVMYPEYDFHCPDY